MMKYQLIVDSCCELTEDLKESLHAISIPLKMLIGDDEYVDDENLDIENFLNVLKDVKVLPKSSCPSPGDYADAFIKSDADYIFAVTLSSKLSGSYNSAMQGKAIAEEAGKKVHIFDSKSASASELLISLKIKELIESGLNTDEIIAKTDEFIQGSKIFFVLEKNDNLVKNGRMNAFLGKALAALNIRLILGSDGDGNIKLVSKVRGGSANAISELAQKIADSSGLTRGQTLVITHCQNPQAVKALVAKVKQTCSFKQIIIMPTGGLSSMYADIGGVLAAFWSEL
ncbi:MAG: DegV family protein [Eubacteriales bacterium]